MKPTIIYTITDEAPALATASLLPIIRRFLEPAGIAVETRDISLAARVLRAFPDYLDPGQRVSDDLKELGEIVKRQDANVIKLPNISASVPQLEATIAELQQRGFSVPDYPDEPTSEEEREIRSRYDHVKGSAVNPVLREGNSDRRVARSVKAYARKHPHSMGEWSGESKTHVSSMDHGDFYGSEKSTVCEADTTVCIEFVGTDGGRETLKEGITLLQGEIADSAVMSRSALRSFLTVQIEDARAKGVLFSVHLKATMMKVSDPIIFGQVVRAYFDEIFKKYGTVRGELGFNPNNGLGDLLARLEGAPAAVRQEILDDIARVYEKGPDLAMVNSDRGITNLHVPSDVIIDASMPAAIRNSGKMWGPDGDLRDMKAVIPDRSYAGVYQAVVDFCRTNGAFDPTTMGNVSNVGLMAQKAEEYGSHDTTFEIAETGTVQIVDAAGTILLEQSVERGDIFRMCRVRDLPVREWVKLAVSRARETGIPTVFWLDEGRAHDRELIRKVETYLDEIRDLDIRILAPAEAATFTLERMKRGEDTISVTGNVLRDYLTDLFPILELGTSAKMLSIVPLLKGGRLFETGAGGSAPKHVQQFVEEGHLRWDSLGEFLALTVSLEHLAAVTGNRSATILAQTLDGAVEQLLENRKSPSRKVGELDNRGSHYYLARYWSRALANQKELPDLAENFRPLAEALEEREGQVLAELDAAQGSPVDLGGYYVPEPAKIAQAMRPSETLNRTIEID